MIDARPTPGPFFAWSVVVLSLVAYILSNIDRQLISILIAPMQRDLAISDTQFGVLQGLAYSLFYGIFCIPIATLADRFSRPAVMAGGLAVWSIATMASGLMNSFGHLFVARAIVGIGEASLLPAVYSLVGDLFPRDRLGRAMGVYSLGPFLGSTAAFLLGGIAFHVLGEDQRHLLFGMSLQTWQLTFLVAGAPGLVLAAVVYAVVREPRRQGQRPLPSDRAPFAEVIRYLVAHRGTFLPHFIGFPLLTVSLYAALGWAPAYLIRSEGFTSAQAGLWLGSTSLLAGGGGALLAGFLTDLFVDRRRGAGPFEVGMIAAAILALGMIAMLVLPIPRPALIVVGGAIFFGSFTLAPSVSVIQSIVPSHYRSRVSGIFLLMNMLGQILGNFLIGFMDDRLFGGPSGIHYSLPLFIAATALASAIMLSLGRQSLASTVAERRDA